MQASKNENFPKMEKEIKYQWSKYSSSVFMGLSDRSDEYYQKLADDMLIVDDAVFQGALEPYNELPFTRIGKAIRAKRRIIEVKQLEV